MTERGEDLRKRSQAGLTPGSPGISDLISSELARGSHHINFRFTSSSSGLRPRRTPEGHVTKAVLEIPYSL